MPVLLALCSAVVYGVADYCGGRASRFHPSAIVTMLGQIVSLVLVGAAVVVAGTATPDAATWAWSLAGGTAGAVGLASLYYAFAHGSMTVVAPISAVVGAVLPVVVGLATGERPTRLALAGIALAMVSVALVAGAIGHHEQPTPARIMWLAALAGMGFGMLFVAFDRADSDSGMWPLLAARLSSVPFLAVLSLVIGARLGSNRVALRFAFVAGVLDMAANLLYLEAVRGGLLSLVSVVASLYPASTVMLAFAIDKERVTRWQAIGMVGAALALALVTLGRS